MADISIIDINNHIKNETNKIIIVNGERNQGQMVAFDKYSI